MPQPARESEVGLPPSLALPPPVLKQGAHQGASSSACPREHAAGVPLAGPGSQTGQGACRLLATNATWRWTEFKGPMASVSSRGWKWIPFKFRVW